MINHINFKMSKNKVFELAKEIGISSKKLIEKLHKINIKAGGIVSTLLSLKWKSIGLFII